LDSTDRRDSGQVPPEQNQIVLLFQARKDEQPRFYPAETILASAQPIKADKSKFDINTKRKASPNFLQPPDDLHFAFVIRLVCATNGLCPQTRAALTGIRLVQQFDYPKKSNGDLLFTLVASYCWDLTESLCIWDAVDCCRDSGERGNRVI
jgi:hypothetical protein